MAQVFLCSDADSVKNSVHRVQICPFVDGQELEMRWEFGFIVLSALYAMMGAYVCVMIVKRLERVRDKFNYWMFVWLGGAALGGSSIWTMHFIGMKAMKIGNVPMQITMDGDVRDVEGIIEVQFEVTLTIISLVAAICVVALGLYIISCRGSVLDKPCAESTQPRIRLVACIWATAVCVMHYMGMWAQTGHFNMEWGAGIMVLSAVIALVVAYAGLCILFSHRVVPTIMNQWISAMIIGIAVCSMHYTGMYSATYTFKANGTRNVIISDWHGNFVSAYGMSVIVAVIKFFMVLFVQHFDRVQFAASTALLEAEMMQKANRKLEAKRRSSTHSHRSVESSLSGDGDGEGNVHRNVSRRLSRVLKDETNIGNNFLARVIKRCDRRIVEGEAAKKTAKPDVHAAIQLYHTMKMTDPKLKDPKFLFPKVAQAKPVIGLDDFYDLNDESANPAEVFEANEDHQKIEIKCDQDENNQDQTSEIGSEGVVVGA